MRKRYEGLPTGGPNPNVPVTTFGALQVPPPPPPMPPNTGAPAPGGDVPLFANTNKRTPANPLQVPSLSPDMEAITETVFVDDALAEYNRLTAALTVGESRTDYGTVLKALDNAEANARDAHRLFCTAKLEAKRFDLDADVVEAAMWSEATASLQAEKDAGQRNKAITDTDVRNKAQAMFPDEYRATLLKREKVKRMVDQMERLADLWFSRCRDVNTMLSTLRK